MREKLQHPRLRLLRIKIFSNLIEPPIIPIIPTTSPFPPPFFSPLHLPRRVAKKKKKILTERNFLRTGGKAHPV